LACSNVDVNNPNHWGVTPLEKTLSLLNKVDENETPEIINEKNYEKYLDTTPSPSQEDKLDILRALLAHPKIQLFTKDQKILVQFQQEFPILFALANLICDKKDSSVISVFLAYLIVNANTKINNSSEGMLSLLINYFATISDELANEMFDDDFKEAWNNKIYPSVKNSIKEDIKKFLSPAIAETFLLIVLLSDDLLAPKTEIPQSTLRFLKIAKELPMELQMVLSHRVHASLGSIVPGEDFRWAQRKMNF
jgi:hypothetical protein